MLEIFDWLTTGWNAFQLAAAFFLVALAVRAGWGMGR